jgi:membrane protease YdiL (CAAX protease family)
MPPDETDLSPVEPRIDPLEPRFELSRPVDPGEPHASAREPFWGYADLALVLGLSFASIIIIVLGVFLATLFYPKLKSDPAPLLLPTQLALYGFVYLSFLIVLGARYHQPVFQALGWRRTNVNLWIAGGGGIVLAFAVSGLAALLHTPKVPSPIDELVNSPISLVIFGIMAVTIAPLFEELFFRGFIQPLLSRTFGVVAGILITAVFFGSLHAPEYSWAWQYALAVAVVGVVLGWVRAWSNSIIPSTVMHGCYNAAFVVAYAFSKHS